MVQNVSECLSERYLMTHRTFSLVAKPGMVMEHHKPKCHAEKLVLCVQCQSHSEGLYNQNMTISVVSPSKGGRGCLMSPPCLESQDCHLIPLCYLLSCSSAQSCYPFYLILFCLLVLSSELFPENSSIFFVKRQAFSYDSCLAVRRSKLVGGMCSMLPHGTRICCYAFI